MAVGAPYEDVNGVVFIFLGSKNGLQSKPAQTIKGRKFSPSISAFGFSLSGGLDLDNNQYTGKNVEP